MSKNKRLKMSLVAQENKIYDEYVEIDVKVGDKDYVIKLYPFFSPSKVKDMLNDVLEFYKLAKEQNLKIKDDEFEVILGYYIIKHFTDIQMTGSKKATVIYKEIKEAVNSRLFDELLKSIPKESIEYVYEKIFEMQDTLVKLESVYKNVIEEIKNLPLENRDILFPQVNSDKKNN